MHGSESMHNYLQTIFKVFLRICQAAEVDIHYLEQTGQQCCRYQVDPASLS